MSVTLSNGYKRPESGDLGSSFFPDLEDNITRLNDHTHNGQNSNKLTALSFTTLTDNIASVEFALVGTRYQRDVTVPTGLEVDTTKILFRDPVTKDVLYLEKERLTNTTFRVYSMFQIDVEIVYG